MATIKIKRVYEPKEKSDGFRILVDRLWPRGIKKEELHVDTWLKKLLHQQSCVNGLIMMKKSGANSKTNIMQSLSTRRLKK